MRERNEGFLKREVEWAGYLRKKGGLLSSQITKDGSRGVRIPTEREDY